MHQNITTLALSHTRECNLSYCANKFYALHLLYCAFTFICFSIYASVDKAPLFGKYYFTSSLFWQTKQQLVQNSKLLLKHNLKTGPCWIVTLSVVLATTVTTRTLLWFHQRTCMRQLQLFLLLHPRHLVILDLCLFLFVLFCFVFLIRTAYQHCSLRKQPPSLLAPRHYGRFARRDVWLATGILYWWRKICPESTHELSLEYISSHWNIFHEWLFCNRFVVFTLTFLAFCLLPVNRRQDLKQYNQWRIVRSSVPWDKGYGPGPLPWIRH